MIVGAGGGCLVVDPGVTADEVAALVAAIDARGWRPVAVWSTHPHWDHLLDGPGLAGLPRWWAGTSFDRAALVAARDCDEVLAAHLAAHPDDRAADVVPIPPVPAPVLSADGALPRLDWDGPEVRVLAHDAHAPGHGALVLPDAGVLVAGDMLSDVEIPLLDLESPDPVGTYVRALDALAAAVERWGLSVVVPGHGRTAVGDEITRRIAADRTYLDDPSTGDPRARTGWLAAAHEAQCTATRRHAP